MLRSFLSIFSGKVGTLILSLIITPVIVRLLGSGGYGTYSVFLSLYSLSIIFVNAGVFDSIRKYMSEERNIEDWQSRVFGYYSYFSILLVLVYSLIFALIYSFGIFERVLDDSVLPYILLLPIFVCVKQAFRVLRSGLMGVSKEPYSESLNVFRKLTFGVTAITFIYLGLGIMGAISGHIIAGIIASFLSFAVLKKDINIGSVLRPNRDTLPQNEFINFNIYSTLLMFLIVSLYHIDILILQYYMGNEITGYYRVSLVVAEFIWFIPIVLQILLVHSTTELWQSEKTEQITELSSNITRYVILITSLISIGLISLADSFIPLYFGSEFSNSVTPLLLLLPGVLGFAVARPILAIGQGKGSVKYLVQLTFFAAAASVFLNLVLIPTYGMNGAAIGTSMSYGLMGILHIFGARKMGYNPVNDIRVGRITLTICLSGPLIIYIRQQIEHTIIALITIPPIGAIVFLIFALSLNAISKSELKKLIKSTSVL